MDVDTMVRLILLLFTSLVIVGCEARYRYPCQNPDNWDKDYCKKPYCEVSRDCPEHIFKGQEGVASFSSPSKCEQCKGAK
jgi:hypothetical protein